MSGKLKIWSAKMPLDGENPDASPVPWKRSAYDELQASFEGLDDVSIDENSVPFDILTRADNLERFEQCVSEFVAHCREAADT